MQTLDTLGAGFQLASHDLDIRGAGNLLGDEQSGHIREVGIELYQHMLEEAVAVAKTAGGPNGGSGDGDGGAAEEWSPQITIGTPVLIPEAYVADLGVRLGLYRRIAQLAGRREREAFAAELIDRFGPLPAEVENLLQIIAIKRRCREAGVERVEAGPKGAVITLRGNRFANPAGACRTDPEARRHVAPAPRPAARLSAQLGGRTDPPQGRRRADAGARPARPRRHARGGARRDAAADPGIGQEAGGRAAVNIRASLPRLSNGRNIALRSAGHPRIPEKCR